MMNLETWQIFRESLHAGNVTLGLGQPRTVGGPLGAFSFAEDFGDDGDDEDDDDKDDEDEYDGQQTDDGDDDHKEGDLVGSSRPDEGPSKSWPPDSEEEDNGLPTPGEEMMGGDEGDDDFLASLGAGAGGSPVGNDDDLGGLEGGEEGEGDDFLASLGAGAGDAPKAPEFGDDTNMDFLNDINPELMGREFGGGEEGEGDAEGMPGAPCPDCNPDGAEEMGDMDCPQCGGVGFLDDGGDEYGPELTGSEDFTGDLGDEADHAAPAPAEMNAFMSKMAQYMQKHMRKEWSEIKEFAPALPMQAAQPPLVAPPTAVPPQQAGMQQQQQPLSKRMVSFMSKKGMKKFMAADAPRSPVKKFMKKDAKQHCPCESDNDFMKSLYSQGKGDCYRKNGSGISEEALFKLAEPNAEYAKGYEPGQVGFAPQGRVGEIGGGYTQDDVRDIPVVGESRRYPTLAEYAAYKARKRASR